MRIYCFALKLDKLSRRGRLYSGEYWTLDLSPEPCRFVLIISMSGRSHLVGIVFGRQLRSHGGERHQPVTWSLLSLTQRVGFLSEMLELFDWS